MPALRPIAIADSYGAIHSALRAYVDEVGISRLALDELIGWTSGYSSKVLGPRPTKHLTSKTLSELLQATGLVLIVAQDVSAFARRQHQFQRDASQVRPDNGRKRGPQSIRQARGNA
ncbi:hypothetical protein ABIB99_001905 [Bradyrhizobium sp. LA6.1]|uniref:hypothetical protein n=1 Tax=Bradyrhizobium sp. LA6.1 TaxID=3156378 RepID=UPI003390A3FD